MNDLPEASPGELKANIVGEIDKIRKSMSRLDQALKERNCQKVQDELGHVKRVNFILSVLLGQPKPSDESYLKLLALGPERSLLCSIDAYKRDQFFSAFFYARNAFFEIGAEYHEKEPASLDGILRLDWRRQPKPKVLQPVEAQS